MTMAFSKRSASHPAGRRQFLAAMGLGGLYYSTRGAFAQALVQTPAQTLGPYYPDRLPLDPDNDLILINESLTPAVGEISWISGHVLDSSGSPVRGAVVEIWQADNNGAYIHSASPIANRDANFQGYGRFETASSGEYVFRTVKPGLYPGRTRHIHYQITVPGRGRLVTQLYVQGESLNANDGVLNGISNAAQRSSVVVAWTSVEGSRIGELAANFDIVLGITPEESPAGGRPVVSTRMGVVDGAAFQAGMAPGAWITIYGSNLSSTTRTWNLSDFVGSKLPTSLDGVSVRINGKQAFVSYISPTQLNVLAPADTISGIVPVTVTTSEGTSDPVNATLLPLLPGFFRLTKQYVLGTHPDGRYLGPAGILENTVTQPATPGSVVVLYGTGFGPSSPEALDGEIISTAAPLANPATVQIGHRDAVVQYAGLVSAGLYQFNVVTPDLDDGDYPVTASVNGVRTASVARMRIQR